MKKTVLACVTAVAILFVSAVGLCLQVLSAPKAVFSLADQRMKIVLDAGHGGIDGGVISVTKKVKESEVNLAITMRLKETLEDAGFDVTLTRKTDAGLYDAATKGFKRKDMERRREIIQDKDPSFVISIHQNRYPSASTRGAQVFFEKDNPDGERFACALQEQLNALYGEKGVKSRQVKSGDYFMLRCTKNPSVIVECGFLSSPADEKLLLNAVWQRRLAERITAGVTSYLAGEVS